MEYSYIEQAEQDEVNPCFVSSCSECNMDYIDGEVNVKGMLHRVFNMGHWGSLDCRKCKVHIKSRESGEFERVCREMDGQC